MHGRGRGSIPLASILSRAADKKRAAIGARRSPPALPPSTSTATARSPRNGDEPGVGRAAGRRRRTRRCRSCRRRSRARPPSAVPVPPVDDGAHQLAQRARPAASRGPARCAIVARAGAARASGPRRPSPATPAMISGLATIRSWPIIIAAARGRRVALGTLPSAAGTPSFSRSPSPKSRAVSGQRAAAAARSGERDERRVAGLREVGRGTGRAPAAPPSKLRNERPSTTSVGGHGTVWSTDSPSRSSAVVVITLNVEPGG